MSGPNQVAFADLRGNRQLLSTGNLTDNPRVSLFLMDYPTRTRLKLLGTARVLDAREHPELARSLAAPGMVAGVERVFSIDVLSYDWNCPKYITPRFTPSEIEASLAPFRTRIAELEKELQRLRSEGR